MKQMSSQVHLLMLRASARSLICSHESNDDVFFWVDRRMEELLVLLVRCCPRVSLSRRLLLVALTLFVVMCLVISIFTFFSDRYNRRDDT